MRVDVRKSGDVIIVDLDGDLVSGVGDEVLRQAMNELVAEGYERILLNLSGVSKIDSSGIGELLASVKLGKRFGYTVRMVNPGRKVREVLDLTQILPLLQVHANEAEAMAAFASEAPAE